MKIIVNGKSILNQDQINVLECIKNEKSITDMFYLGGGTALAEYYLKHRLSEDLDFFAIEEFEPESINIFFKKIADKTGIKKVNFQQSFNRNLFLLEMRDQEIKTEFTYYPFEKVEIEQMLGNLKIDSLLDIAVNKVFTIYQKPRSRDFIDLYCILQQEKTWTMEDLIKKAQVKFDNYIDPLQFAAQCQKAQTLQDYPTLLINLDKNLWINFFLELSKKLVGEQVE